MGLHRYGVYPSGGKACGTTPPVPEPKPTRLSGLTEYRSTSDDVLHVLVILRNLSAGYGALHGPAFAAFLGFGGEF